MRSDQEIKKIRTSLNRQIDSLELLVIRKSETIMNIETCIVFTHLSNEANLIRDEIKFLRKEINVLEGQIKLIDWFLGKSNEIKFYGHE